MFILQTNCMPVVLQTMHSINRLKTLWNVKSQINTPGWFKWFESSVIHSYNTQNMYSTQNTYSTQNMYSTQYTYIWVFNSYKHLLTKKISISIDYIVKMFVCTALELGFNRASKYFSLTTFLERFLKFSLVGDEIIVFTI